MTERRLDVVLAVTVSVVLAAVANSDPARSGLVDPVAYLWAIGLGLLMLVRRNNPVFVLVLSGLGFFAYYAAGLPSIGVGLPMAAALFSAAEAGHTRASAATGSLVLAGATAYRLGAGQDLPFVLGYELITHGSLMAGAIALGHSLQVHRALRRRSDQVVRLITRQSELHADARLREDRLILARELHDSLGHSLTMAGLYAQVAQEGECDQQRSEAALRQVRSSVADGLTQLRATVSVLRRPDAQARGRRPVGLADLQQLADAPRAAGYEVVMTVADTTASAAVGAAVHRVVQEAITNIVRHACADRIQVDIIEDPAGVVRATVSDNGRGGACAELPIGHGLHGMRERVRELGGTLDVTPGVGGWCIGATIPMEVEPHDRRAAR